MCLEIYFNLPYRFVPVCLLYVCLLYVRPRTSISNRIHQRLGWLLHPAFVGWSIRICWLFLSLVYREKSALPYLLRYCWLLKPSNKLCFMFPLLAHFSFLPALILISAQSHIFPPTCVIFLIRKCCWKETSTGRVDASSTTFSCTL